MSNPVRPSLCYVFSALLMSTMLGTPSLAFAGYGDEPSPQPVHVAPPSFAQSETPSAPVKPSTGTDKIEPRYEAMARLKLNDAPGACRVLDENYPADSRDEDILYLRGRCNMELKNYPKAIGYYETLLSIRPDATRAQLELGKAYALTGKRSKAQKLYKGVLANNPPQTLAKNIEDALALLDRQKPWYIRTEVGGIYDTNINSGPSSDQIVVFDTPVTLAGGARSTDSFGYVATADAGYSHMLSPTAAIVVQGSVGHTDYAENGDFDITTAQIGIGPAKTWGKLKTILQPNYSYQALGGNTYRTAWGLTNRTTYKIGDNTEAGLSILAQKTHYPTITGREGTSVLISPDLTYNFSTGTKVTGGILTRFEDADNSIFSHTALGGRINANQVVTPTIKLNAGYQYLNSDYDGRQPAFGNVAREDDQHVGTARVDWDISGFGIKNVGISAKYQYINTRSNIDAYQFDRHISVLSVTKSW